MHHAVAPRHAITPAPPRHHTRRASDELMASNPAKPSSLEFKRTLLRSGPAFPRYVVTDKPPRAGHPDWKRVVAVVVQARRRLARVLRGCASCAGRACVHACIAVRCRHTRVDQRVRATPPVCAQGKAWQFKGFPFSGADKGELVDTFSSLFGAYFHYSDEAVRGSCCACCCAYGGSDGRGMGHRAVQRRCTPRHAAAACVRACAGARHGRRLEGRQAAAAPHRAPPGPHRHARLLRQVGCLPGGPALRAGVLMKRAAPAAPRSSSGVARWARLRVLGAASAPAESCCCCWCCWCRCGSERAVAHLRLVCDREAAAAVVTPLVRLSRCSHIRNQLALQRKAVALECRALATASAGSSPRSQATASHSRRTGATSRLLPSHHA